TKKGAQASEEHSTSTSVKKSASSTKKKDKEATSCSTSTKPKVPRKKPKKREGHTWYWDYGTKNWVWQAGSRKFDFFKKRPPKPTEPPADASMVKSKSKSATSSMSSSADHDKSKKKPSTSTTSSSSSSSSSPSDQTGFARRNKSSSWSSQYNYRGGSGGFSKWTPKKPYNWPVLGFSPGHDSIHWFPKKDNLLSHTPSWASEGKFLVASGYLIYDKKKEKTLLAEAAVAAKNSPAGANTVSSSISNTQQPTSSSFKPSAQSSSCSVEKSP
ncbi:unnamed protein product, partial [Amoebophrya sp. A25]